MVDDTLANVDHKRWPADLQKRWIAESTRLASLPGGYALIDPLIWEIVVAFNLMGFETTQSCQGHTNQSRAYIDIANPPLPGGEDAAARWEDDPAARPQAPRLAALLENARQTYPLTLQLQWQGWQGIRVTFPHPNPCAIGTKRSEAVFPDVARTYADRVEIASLLATMMATLANGG